MRPPTDAPEGALFGCVVDDSTGKKIGSLRSISSALAVCETPAVVAPSPALAAYAGYVYTLDGESVVTDAGGGGFGHDRGEAPPTIAALEGVTAYASSTPAAVRGAWGGDTLILALTRDVHVEASSSSSSGSDVRVGLPGGYHRSPGRRDRRQFDFIGLIDRFTTLRRARVRAGDVPGLPGAAPRRLHGP
jgi:hypothetical protein